ncbi:MAG: ABC transporter ATP-binding protein [Deltaproteobacteria bacterium]|nr:ABC transporter ATP-binding protein [Deltaproteobacteria bacterium]MBI4374756.1 ABC transporter ATP-binding protein [Deltaproteobacteria bacterium]
MGELLKVENLKTYFFTSQGVGKAVDGVSFSVKEGGRLGIVGESGSGKSVTALSLLRLVSPPGRIVGGRVLFDGSDLLGASEEKMREVRGGKIAMVFQEPGSSLNPVFTIGSQIEEAVELHQKTLSPDERRKKVLESLELVKIADPGRVAKSYPHELSGGMKQRAMIAMALSCRPRLLIADEPTTALDVTVQAQVLDLLGDLQSSLGMALILITHDLGIVSEAADDLIVMKEGVVVESGKTATIIRGARHPYTRHLMEIYERFNHG